MTTTPPRMGQLPTFDVTITAPDGFVVDALTVRVCKPDGTIRDDSENLVELEPNRWRYVGGEVIDQHGTWVWNVSTSGAFRGSFDKAEIVPYSPFTVETWDRDDFTGS